MLDNKPVLSKQMTKFLSFGLGCAVLSPEFHQTTRVNIHEDGSFHIAGCFGGNKEREQYFYGNLRSRGHCVVQR